LITAGSGGVGGFAIQLAKLAGLHPIIATCSPSNADHVRKLGADEVIDYTSENVAERALAITNGTHTSTRGLQSLAHKLRPQSRRGR
jgi:NADPH:quinone reductase-like Zn-dependent oxidoreductase